MKSQEKSSSYRPQFLANPHRNTVYAPMTSRKWHIGQRVIGNRPRAQGGGLFSGTLVESYYTINDNQFYGVFKNPGYIVKCDIDGKYRSFQCLLSPPNQNDEPSKPKHHVWNCSKCGHEVVTSGDRPEPIKWTDGHVCYFVPAD